MENVIAQNELNELNNFKNLKKISSFSIQDEIIIDDSAEPVEKRLSRAIMELANTIKEIFDR
ncbi:MAG: hypothetical protein GY870_04230 [archaeon]|nr:hypothetical protein [archaeon]